MILVFITVFCVIVALGFGAAAAWSDYNKLIIPNVYAGLVGAAFIPAFLAVTFFAPETTFFASWKSHLVALVFMFVVTYALFYFKMIGGGDSKLITAFSLWVGMNGLMIFLFVMAVVGGVLGGITLFFNKNKFFKKPNKESWIAKAQKGKKEVPYGIAIFAGALIAFWRAGYIQPNELMALAMTTIGSSS